MSSLESTPRPEFPSQASPVGAYARVTDTIPITASIGLAAKKLKEAGTSLLPVVDQGEFAGVLRQTDLLTSLHVDQDPSRSIQSLIRPGAWGIRPYQSVGDAIRTLEKSSDGVLVLLGDRNEVLGLVLPADLLSASSSLRTPHPIGGMATPLGVYLTNGDITGGASKLGLILTGALLFVLFFAANAIGVLTTGLLESAQLTTSSIDTIITFETLILFLIGLRSLPLAGTHAAEHMVVHAIERGEPLSKNIVRRMPRVHPRCGTNIAAAAALFLGVFGSGLVHDQELRLLLAALVTLVFWRPLGTFLQYFVTTKPPTDRQIESGIRAGKELLEKYQFAGGHQVSVVHRLWNSGLPEVILGSLLVQLALFSFYWILGEPKGFEVYL